MVVFNPINVDDKSEARPIFTRTTLNESLIQTVEEISQAAYASLMTPKTIKLQSRRKH